MQLLLDRQILRKEDEPNRENGSKRKSDILTFCVRSRFYGQATKGVRVDALAQTGDEGRGQLR